MFEEILTNCRYGYVRVSSQSQENNSSLESQKQELIKLAVPEKNIRVEVFKYLYCGKSIESEEFLSEKICSTTI